jgi:hypothetical protein
MPTITKISGVKIKMYFKDHAPPHVHAEYGEHEVLLCIANAATYAGSLPSPQLAIAQEYVLANTAFLMSKWAELGGAA